MALMGVIIISLILIALSVTLGMSGYFTRFNILEAQTKLQSDALAESCTNLAMSRLTQGSSTSYLYPEKVVLGSDDCLIAGITSSGTHRQISTSADFLNTFTNLSVGTTVSSSNLTPSQAVVLVRVLVNNMYGGTKTASDFIVNISASGANPVTFNGDSNGTPVYIDPGSFSASISTTIPSNYSAPVGTNCSISGIVAGDNTNVCTITINDKPTTATLTVIANVINNNGGTKQPSDFVLSINGANQISGSPKTGLIAGTYTVSSADMSGYSVSSWDSGCAGGAVTLAAGDTKTCTVVYDDNPPPTPGCADTVMMLDRTGSLFGNAQDPINEGIAASSLLDLYSTVTSLPLVGVGSMGGLYVNGTNPASVPDGTNGQPTGLLTNNYGTKSTTVTLGPNPATATGTPNQWTNPTNALINDGIFATDATNGHQEVYKNFGLSVPAGATISGIGVVVDAKTSVSATDTSNLLPTATSNYNTWTAVGSANKVTDITANDGDTNYISDTTLNNAQTYVFANAGVPAGSTINSISVVAYAKASSGTPTIKFRTEKGNGNNNLRDSATNITLTNTYTAYTNQMTTNPFTSAAWTLAEVNSWTSHFGVIKTSSTGTVAVTQIYVVVNYTPQSSLGAALSWNNGTSWTTGAGAKTMTPTSVEADTLLGSASDTWNRTWAVTDFSNTNFLLRLTNSSSSGTISLDYVTVTVYYSTPSTGLYRAIDTMMKTSSSGAGSHISSDITAGNTELNSSRHNPSQQKVLIVISDGVPTDTQASVTTAANTAKNSGTKLFTIHFGDPAGATFLASLSSGSGYSFDAPTSADMATIFQDIGKLVCPAIGVVQPPPPTHANLIVITNVTNNNSGTATAANFSINVSAVNPSQTSFTGVASPGTNIQVDPGAYTITEGLVSGYSESLDPACSGTIVAGATQTCIINNDDLPPPPPVIPPVQTPPTITIDTWLENP